MLCKKVACFGFWKKEHIDLLIKRGLLDVGAPVTRDEITEWNIQVSGGREETSVQAREKVLTRFVGVVKEVVYLLKCVIFHVVLFGSVLLVRN